MMSSPVTDSPQYQYALAMLLLQEAMARQAPTYASHIAQIRQQAMEETAAERGRLQGQLGRVQAEMKRLQSCCEADHQATQDLMEVEKIQVKWPTKKFRSVCTSTVRLCAALCSGP